MFRHSQYTDTSILFRWQKCWVNRLLFLFILALVYLYNKKWLVFVAHILFATAFTHPNRIWAVTNYAHLNWGSINFSWYVCDLQTQDHRYLAVDHTTSGGWWEQPHHQWPTVTPSIIQYSLTNLGRMKSWVVLAAWGGREIWWYDLHGELNPGHSHGSTMVYPLCYSYLKLFWWKLYSQDSDVSNFIRSDQKVPPYQLVVF